VTLLDGKDLPDDPNSPIAIVGNSYAAGGLVGLLVHQLNLLSG
jgi:hypothetical protein